MHLYICVQESAWHINYTVMLVFYLLQTDPPQFDNANPWGLSLKDHAEQRDTASTGA